MRHKEVMEFDLNNESELPITAEDRKKYCTDFIGRRTVEQDLRAISDVFDLCSKEEKKKEELKKIDWLTIPQLEQLLSKISEKLGLIKLMLEKPNLKKQVIVEFSVQDPSNKTSQESIKTLTKALKKELAPTNWRLMTTGISYRLGVLCGSLKGQEQNNYGVSDSYFE